MNIKRHSIFLWLTTSILAILMAVGMTIYFNTYQASPLARRIAKTATNHKNYLLFRSKGKVKANIIFYQGALVEEEAYSQLARDLADKGDNTYILKTPLNLPVLSPHKAKTIINQNHLTNVYLAGHSLGGVVASQNAKVAPVRGLILLASYPSRKSDLSHKKLRVLSITASNDHILNWEKYEEAKKRLPNSSTFRTIVGGNHSRFGNYGHQKGDGKATLSHKSSEKQLATFISNFIH
ncbi:TPA: alpha/beta hydrolase [Streptococcus agalactiae]|uniref:Thioesterase n=3 Tax=Streptococcus agalactiae TaxID=1311 RepID=A0A853P567_STRAG|nr:MULTISPECIES: alpha/beta hydrolase [Streptococcus]EAO63035.1 carboxymethylenebutenolidase-related protein [Streptococcus agalactiae 18RS21]EAO78696.1 carboxymethylenebutenolidase-related protein [Streptococcus agalactiae H36B]HEO2248299.1 alpha/beta hydrolase [Streptococcus agalactiae 515]AIF86072.1 thioesterase [Streptococcus agalactiae]ALB15608.1 thioesterase [Streptococcus agalactiae]